MDKTIQRIEIAKACGYTEIYAHDVEGIFLCQPPSGTPRPYPFQIFSVPDYLNDLNAIHEAEKSLSGEMKIRLLMILAEITSEEELVDSMVAVWRAYHATAEQRAEALLRTLSLWTE